MRISKIHLKNIRCFEELTIDLSKEDDTKSWLMILGENGVGKTTLLRCIALGLCEKSGASGLIAEVPGNWLKPGAKEGVIEIDVLPYKGYSGERAFVRTTLTEDLYDETNLSQLTSPTQPSDFKWEQLFVCAYGSARTIYGSMDVFEYAVTDSVYSLFNYDADLQNPELCIRRLSDSGTNSKEIFKKLEEVLMIDENSITLESNGIFVNGPWGRSMHLSTLGDGYQSTITWLMDFYGWKLLAEKFREKDTGTSGILDFEGIVIIDEIEKHLHPKWQKQLIGLLSRQFPKIQFIVATHSPLCVIGTTELDDNDCCIAVSRQIRSEVETNLTKPPRGKRVDQVLTSYLFDLYTTSDDQTQEAIARYRALYQNTVRTAKEEIEFKDLHEFLNSRLGSPENEFQIKVEKAVSDTLTKMSSDALKKIEADSPDLFEIRRQLKSIFKPNDKD